VEPLAYWKVFYSYNLPEECVIHARQASKIKNNKIARFLPVADGIYILWLLHPESQMKKVVWNKALYNILLQKTQASGKTTFEYCNYCFR